jgi:hypothetical protein
VFPATSKSYQPPNQLLEKVVDLVVFIQLLRQVLRERVNFTIIPTREKRVKICEWSPFGFCSFKIEGIVTMCDYVKYSPVDLPLVQTLGDRPSTPSNYHNPPPTKLSPFISSQLDPSSFSSSPSLSSRPVIFNEARWTPQQ